jgi:hypothetical protein
VIGIDIDAARKIGAARGYDVAVLSGFCRRPKLA